MKLIKRVYQLCGLNFVEKNFIKVLGISEKFSVVFVFLLHFIYIAFNLHYQFNFHVELFKHPDIVGNTTNLLEMVAPLFCHLTIILESLCKRRKDEKMRNLIRKLNCILHTKVKSFPFTKFLFLFIINSLIYVTALIFAFHYISK